MGSHEYNVKINSSPDVLGAFNDLPIKTVNGVPIYIKDVAHVADGFAVQTNIVRVDGRRAVLMTILKGEGASTITVVDQVRAALAPHPGPASGRAEDGAPVRPVGIRQGSR